MKRRAFITLIGGAAVAWPLAAARAQQLAMPVIGFLGASTPSNWATWTTAFVQGLRALGWVEGRTVKIEYRWAEGQSQRYAEIAAEFARLKVDVIVTVGSAVPAAMQATATIPIVFAAAIEPVESGLVASLVKPGGNVTGFSVQSIDQRNAGALCLSECAGKCQPKSHQHPGTWCAITNDTRCT
jgi:putative tryptophan/tyrosine transport system substrate-binding protein